MTKPIIPIDTSELARIDQALKVQIDILRHSATVEADILRVLEQMRKELIAKLAQADMPNWSKQRLNQMLKEASATIADYYAKAQRILSPSYSTVAGISAAQAATALAVTAPSRAVLESLVGNMLVEGAPMKAWWAKQSTDTSFKFASAVRQGIAQSETLNQIFKRVNAATDLANRNSIALVHTSVMQVFNSAKLNVIQANADIAPTTRWLSALDSHVCWSAETLILMADGTQTPAGRIQIGDMVIGGVTGKPCRVVNAGSRIVASSVVIHYNNEIIGRVTHDHPVLTESGWKDIGSVSLSADISEREVLCRVFRAPEETVSGTPEICGERRGIRPAQCNTEAREACNDNTCIEPNPAGSLRNGGVANQGTQHESAPRLQHDERRGGCGRAITGNTESDGASAVEAVQRGCRIQGKDARGWESVRAEGWSYSQDIQCYAGGARDNSGAHEFRLVTENNPCTSNTSNPRSARKIARSSKSTMGGCHVPNKNECSAGSEASGTTHYKSRMGRSASGENVRYHEGEVGRPCIPCENGAAETPRNICGSTCTGSKEPPCCYDDTRKESGDFGETSPVVGETEGVKVGTITGAVDDTPVEVFNFTVADDHSYVAGGVIVHNCLRCAPRDGLEWDTKTLTPIGHNIPFDGIPLHIGCRCTAYGVTRLTKRMDELGIGQRASTFGPVARTTTFSDFLARQTPAWQDSMLGKGRGELYRQGKITLRDTVSGRGAPLSLAALKKKYDH